MAVSRISLISYSFLLPKLNSSWVVFLSIRHFLIQYCSNRNIWETLWIYISLAIRAYRHSSLLDLVLKNVRKTWSQVCNCLWSSCIYCLTKLSRLGHSLWVLHTSSLFFSNVFEHSRDSLNAQLWALRALMIVSLLILTWSKGQCLLYRKQIGNSHS